MYPSLSMKLSLKVLLTIFCCYFVFVQVTVDPCSLLSRKLQMKSRANIEHKEPRLFGDIVPGHQTYLKQLVSLRKYICALWAIIVQVIFLCK